MGMLLDSWQHEASWLGVEQKENTRRMKTPTQRSTRKQSPSKDPFVCITFSSAFFTHFGVNSFLCSLPIPSLGSSLIHPIYLFFSFLASFLALIIGYFVSFWTSGFSCELLQKIAQKVAQCLKFDHC